MSGPHAGSDVVRIERLLAAPIEDVFAAWTEPAQMAMWLSPRGRAEVEADVVVGGRLHVVMADRDVRIEHEGEFLELEPPVRVRFTWRSRFTGDEPSVVTVELHDEDGSTRLVLTHDRLPPEARASHAGGWSAILDHLAAVLAAGAAHGAG
ncbi:MAG TPA: SRPBCC domain-containing protein [Actinomycetota bacterium]|nr:SRPBCC domain-containing protein [Actinomycetota bacterium]